MQPPTSNKLCPLAAAEAPLEGGFTSGANIVLNVKTVRAETLRMTDYQRQNPGGQTEVQRPRVRRGQFWIPAFGLFPLRCVALPFSCMDLVGPSLIILLDGLQEPELSWRAGGGGTLGRFTHHFDSKSKSFWIKIKIISIQNQNHFDSKSKSFWIKIKIILNSNQNHFDSKSKSF